MVGTRRTQELCGVVTGKTPKWKWKWWRARKTTTTTTTKGKLSITLWFGCDGLRELGFKIAAKCGYPQQQIYALWAHMCGDRVKQWTVPPLWYYTPENNTRKPQKNKQKKNNQTPNIYFSLYITIHRPTVWDSYWLLNSGAKKVLCPHKVISTLHSPQCVWPVR